MRSLAGGWQAWQAYQRHPVEQLPRYQQLVHIDWLRELLDGGRPEGRGGLTYCLASTATPAP